MYCDKANMAKKFRLVIWNCAQQSTGLIEQPESVQFGRSLADVSFKTTHKLNQLHRPTLGIVIDGDIALRCGD